MCIRDSVGSEMCIRDRVALSINSLIIALELIGKRKRALESA
jgi:hypothetical protein